MTYKSKGGSLVGERLSITGLSIYNFGLGGRVQESPTVTYTPLHGGEFVRQVMSPIDLSTLLLLYHSGWAVDRILRICVQEFNDVPNASGASGPTPDRAPVYEGFLTAMRQLRTLQRQGQLDLGWIEEEKKVSALTLRVPPDVLNTPEWQQVAQIFSLAPDRSDFRISVGIRRVEAPGEVRIVPRSMVSALFYLSHGVEVPSADTQAGRVTLTQDTQGQPFDWDRVTGDLLRIHSSAQPPDNAAVRTRYRGNWFYIDDSDLSSKSTFAMLTQLFALQAGEVPSMAPLLTLPVAR